MDITEKIAIESGDKPFSGTGIAILYKKGVCLLRGREEEKNGAAFTAVRGITDRSFPFVRWS
jgi:hypothetical protein